MRVFVTGATGFIGTAVVQDLIEGGPQGARPRPFGRGRRGARRRRGRGAPGRSRGPGQPAERRGVIGRGDPPRLHPRLLKVPGGLRGGQAGHRGAGRCARRLRPPLVITSGTGMGTAVPGQPATEDHFDPNHPNPRAASEFAAEAVAARGVSVSVVRLPQVHNTEKQGLVTPAIAVAREKGVAAYVGDGLNRWPAVHLLDAAPVYRLALEKGTTRARYHAVAEEGVTAREIAEAIGRGLKIPVVSMSPEEAAGHFGWLGFFAGMDMPASSALTQQRLGWHPTQKAGMIDDLDHMNWSAV